MAKEQARIDKTGLHVRQSIDYGGIIGTADYDKRTAAEPKH